MESKENGGCLYRIESRKMVKFNKHFKGECNIIHKEFEIICGL